MIKELITKQKTWEIILLVVSGILISVILAIIKMKVNSIKYISITDHNILNIDSKGKLQYINKTKIFSNLINHQLTVENKGNMKQAITEIIISQIKKVETHIPDIQLDGGFYEKFQKYLLIGYNNGNIESKVETIRLQVCSVEQNTFCENLIDEIFSDDKIIDSGSVESIFLIDLKKYYSIFDNNKKLSDLKIIALDENGNEIQGFFILVRYDRDEKMFKPHPRGLAGPGVEKLPLIDITKDVTKATAKTHQILEQGANQVGFNILVDRTCILKYKIKIKSGHKVIIDNSNYEVKIRIPEYNQEVGMLEGDFYYFIYDNVVELENHFVYSKQNIKTISPKLVFDKYRTVKEIYK